MDLTCNDGQSTASRHPKLVSEIRTDMTKWPSAKHFASWLGLSADNRLTDSRVIGVAKTKLQRELYGSSIASG